MPVVDLTGAAGLMRAPASVQGAMAGEKLDVYVGWQTASSSVAIDDGTTTLLAPPSSLVAAGDTVTAQAILSATSGTTYTTRLASHRFTGSETTFTMPPVLTGVTFSAAGAPPSATWATLPAHEWVSFGAYTATNGLTIEASSGWTTAHAPTSLSFDDEPTGYQASWRVALSGRYTCSLYAGSKGETTELIQIFGS